MKKLCTKSGVAVCCDCSDSFKETVLCREYLDAYVHYMEETIEDMIYWIYCNSKDFNSRQDVADRFDFKFKDGRSYEHTRK